MNAQPNSSPNPPSGCGPVRFESRRELMVQLTELKQSVLHEFEPRLRGHPDLLKAALTEAEALACQTPYPQLFFPVLAEEKAAAVSRWAARQAAARRANPARAFAA